MVLAWRGSNEVRFKSANGSFEMNWYTKQHTLTFAGKDGPTAKEKLVTMLRTQSGMKAKNSTAAGENIVTSERNFCENDRLGSLINIVDTLNAKFDYLEHQFKDFQINTNSSIEALYNKGEISTKKQKDLEIHRLQEEKSQIIF